jgi:ABC-2 type transport system ATP-binding protein
VTEVKRAAGTRNVAIGLSGGGGAQNGVAEVFRDRRLVQKFDDSNNYIEVELAPNADAQALLRRLVDAGAAIERFELMQPSLHQIFLQRVGATGVETGMSGHG